MLAARSGLAALRTRSSFVVASAGRTAPRALSGKPPEPAEEDDTEEIERAMDAMVTAKNTVGERLRERISQVLRQHQDNDWCLISSMGLVWSPCVFFRVLHCCFLASHVPLCVERCGVCAVYALFGSVSSTSTHPT